MWGLAESPIPDPRSRQESAMRDIIALACNECKRRNYSTTKNKKKTTERLELNKYCRFCRKHTGHRKRKEGAISCQLSAISCQLSAISRWWPAWRFQAGPLESRSWQRLLE